MTNIGLAKATFPDLSNEEFIALAAETGFDFVSLRLCTSEACRENDQILPGSAGLAAVQKALQSTGLPVIDLEFLTLTEKTRPEHWEWMFEVGEALGAKHLDGAGLLLDTLQLARFDETNLAADLKPYVGVIQLCDAPLANPETTEELEFEARYGRIPPGDGEIPIQQILSDIGPDVPVSIECPNTALTESMGVRAYAQYLLERTNKMIADTKFSSATHQRGVSRGK